MKNSVAVSLALLIAGASLPGAARADAVSDQLKAYKAMGLKLDTHRPALCNLITKSEAERYLGKAMQNGVSANVIDGCAYRAADGSNVGLLVTRGKRDDWYPSTTSKQYKTLAGVGEKAYTDYENGLGYEAEALAKNGVTGVQLSGKYPSATAVSLLKLAIRR